MRVYCFAICERSSSLGFRPYQYSTHPPPLPLPWKRSLNFFEKNPSTANAEELEWSKRPENKLELRFYAFLDLLGEIALVIIEMCMLRLVENCVIARYNHLAQGDYSSSDKFQNGCIAFCQCYRGSDILDRRKCNFEECKRCYRVWRINSQKKDLKFCWLNKEKPAKF